MSFGASWKTTVSGAVSAGAALVLFLSQPPFSMHFPVWVSGVAAFVITGGLAALGINAKDKNVTGGSVSQPGIPVAPVPEQEWLLTLQGMAEDRTPSE